MRYNRWRQRLEYLSLFIPIRLYLLFLVAAGLVAFWWVNRLMPAGESLTTSLIELCLRMILYAFAAWLVLGLLSVLIPFLHFEYYRRKGNFQLEIDNVSDEGLGRKPVRRIHMRISPLLQPLFGYNRYRLVYDEESFSPLFGLVQKSRGMAWINTVKAGWYNWPLPAVREYEVNQVIITFEDLFRFFSLSRSVNVKQQFITRPTLAVVPAADIKPQRTEEQVERIEELKRVEGELMHYKNFEANDDVRRIVWKIYARNKELVVRTPEILDPFASHLYLYPSFFDALELQNNYWVQTRGLDYFKNACYSFCHELLKQERPIKLIADQQLATPATNSLHEQLQYQLAASKWQTDKSLQSLVPVQGASVVFVQSLSSVEQLKDILELKTPPHIILVEVSRALRRSRVSNWLRWLFIKPEPDYETQGFADFSRYTTMRSLQQNENKLLQLLEKSGIEFTRITGKQQAAKKRA